MRTIYPVLRYQDPAKAIEWLEAAFGFSAHEVSKGPDGEITHAELTYGTGMIMVGKGMPGGAGVYVAVPDPDGHHDRAAAAGAEITMGLLDQPYGSREYACQDLEGNAWFFGTYQP